jgi:hypothetical protein
MDRDYESKKYGYSAASYLEVLEPEIGLVFEDMELGYEFMQDNTSIYIARKVKAWFLGYGIPIVLNWPLYSPDLNPIKYI